MCSIGDDNFDEIENMKYMPLKEKPSKSDKCNKCRKETPCIVLRSKDKYCRNCFLAGTVHKFKALLGKHKLIRPNDRVMVVHKCGHPSSALLHFIRTGLDLETHKKLRFEPIVIFVEDQLHLSLKERQELVDRVDREIARFNFPKYFMSATQLITTSNIEATIKTKPELLELSDNDKLIIDKFLTKQRNETNKNDFLSVIMRQLWIKIAKYLECKFIFTPELSIDVASQLLTDISLGKGAHASLDTGFCDSRNDVKILRPLRLFDAKELAFYNYLNKLEPVTFRVRQENPYRSVQNLMRKFVNDLQVNYPATVTTILKTGDKLTVGDKSTNKCDFCGAPTGEDNSGLTSAESTQFSHWVSTQTPDYSVASTERYNKIVESFDNITCKNYCYACNKFEK